MIKIEMKDLNDFVSTIKLEGETYRLLFSWNDRAQGWTIGIRDSNDNTIIEKIAMIDAYPLTRQFKRTEMPPGEFFVVGDMKTPINRKSFLEGKRSLVYVTEGEMNAKTI